MGYCRRLPALAVLVASVAACSAGDGGDGRDVVQSASARVRMALLAGVFCTLLPAAAAASGPHMIIPPTDTGDVAPSDVDREYARAVRMMAGPAIEELHNCVQVFSVDEVRSLLRDERERVLTGEAGTGREDVLWGIVHDARYVLATSLVRAGREYRIGFRLVDRRGDKTLARVQLQAPDDAFPPITGKALKPIVDAIPQCRLSMDIEARITGTAGGGTGRGAFAGSVDLETDDAGRITGRGAIAGRVAMDETPEHFRDDATPVLRLPFGVSGTLDESNVAKLRTTGGVASFSAMDGQLSGAATAEGGGSIKLPWRAGKRVAVPASASGGGAVTTLTLRTRP